MTSHNHLVGSVVWVHGPNQNHLPFMAYVASLSELTAECYMVHEEKFLATAEDLIYEPSSHDHHLPLVVQPRLSAEIPVLNLRSTVTNFDDAAMREISQMASGIRRTTSRTGVLVRSTSEFRWDNVIRQKLHLEKVLTDIESWNEKNETHSLLTRSGKGDEQSQIARKYLMQLLRESDWKLLNITKEKLAEVGFSGLSAEFIDSAVQAITEEMVNGSSEELSVTQILEENLENMHESLRVTRQVEEVIDVH